MKFKLFLISLCYLLSIVACSSLDDKLVHAKQSYQQGDYTLALRIWTPLAEHSNAEAQWGMGKLYDSGKIGGQDIEKVIEWLSLSADQK